VGWQDVLQEDLVDAPHRVHTLLLAVQLAAPQKVGPEKQDYDVQSIVHFHSILKSIINSLTNYQSSNLMNLHQFYN